MACGIHATLGEEVKALLRRRRAEVADEVQIGLLGHDLEVPHVGIALSGNVEHLSAWVEKRVKSAGALIQQDHVEGFGLCVCGGRELPHVPDADLPLCLLRKAGCHQFVAFVHTRGAPKPLDLGGLCTFVDFDVVDNRLGPRINDAHLLVLARRCQQGPRVVPLQGQDLVRYRKLEDLLLLAQVPDPASEVEGCGGQDAVGNRIVGAEGDLLAVALERSQGLAHVLLNALVREAPDLDGRVLAGAHQHVVIKGIELKVKDWAGVASDQWEVARQAAIARHGNHGQRAAAARLPGEGKELRISADARRLRGLGREPEVLILLFHGLAKDMSEFGVAHHLHGLSQRVKCNLTSNGYMAC
mmetsp:Transcript_24358/g.66429  ORF Transcript_24358/g.66429 Transcript_24358/m.66429 type:complete len:357 (-) Transcript_24358:27-1097(-)